MMCLRFDSGWGMRGEYVEYQSLSHEQRLEVLKSLADTAVRIVAKHPDILWRCVEEVMRPMDHGDVAWLALSRAVKEGRLIINYDTYHPTLRVPEEPDEQIDLP